AAAAWALERSRVLGRSEAMGNVVRTWANVDPDAASVWVMNLPYGDARDNVLSALIPSVAMSRPLDAQLLAAFNDSQARQQAVVQAMWAVAQRDPAEARALLDAHVTDPQLRLQAEQMLESGSGS